VYLKIFLYIWKVLDKFNFNLINFLGRRAKPKRKFITPIVRQAFLENSSFVSPITHSHWKCLLCHLDIYAAVISAGVIKHYKKFHPIQLPQIQLELCKVFFK